MAVISGFPMPQKIDVVAESEGRYAKFIAAPLLSGFGHTLGNALRRILLSSLEGMAIASVRIEGVAHEFAQIPHVAEDVTEIVLNLKNVKLICHSDAPQIRLQIRKDVAGPVTAGDIVAVNGIEVLNPEMVICTLDKNVAFRAEIEVLRGKGYLSCDKYNKDGQPIGTIPVDALFSPVTRVRYNVGQARVGSETEMDALEIEIWTDGRVSPKDALERSARVLKEHLRPFMGALATEEDSIASISEEDQALYLLLTREVDYLQLSVRAMNCLKNANIRTVGELCMKTEQRMLKYRNFGKKSLDEIKQRLEQIKLSLGMIFSEEITAAILVDSEKKKKSSPNIEE